ncbi:trk system potassium uptake protein TrkH [Desulfacinum infernum DSM 9756]|uniref:Trk system potassium uptake protein TrkH n=1 Tax=Desulfacinum infernum DSM 9756 TaxID=1121391 RepID=A0A1M4URJ8_9BACT|nr:TrkH family potassium uptake protein [Desulfacinum infernum]SHE59362.1 trk system potassium uptake protein TrkH [Desulfacinum infernum DSM 9756]
MRWRYVFRVTGVLIWCVGATLVLPVAFSVAHGAGDLAALLESMAVSLGLGALLVLPFRSEPPGVLGHREGMAIVSLGWIGAALVGALPFYFAGTFDTFADAFFESMSGFTTTGASVLTDIEAVPHGILMWRSLTHWLGGMGIIVLSLAILPFLGVGGMQLYKAEVPSPVPDKLRPRIRDTAAALWKVYLLFTLLETLLLMAGGMSLFEALCHTFGTLATGGFSTKNASIGHYSSAYVDGVIILFMLMAGINFSLHYQLLVGRPKALWRDPELRFFVGLVAVFVLVCTVDIYGAVYDSLSKAFRYASFQVVSIITTTGYATADYEKWPALSQAILLFCMFLGASAGSTGGGMKCLRIMLLMKHGYRELMRLIHPHAVSQLKMGGKSVPVEVIHSVWGFFILYLGLFILSSFLVAAMGVDVVTAFASVAATIGNIGPGLGEVGPADNYAAMPYMAKWLLSLCMLLGRLEIYTVIVLLVPEFWRR